MWLFNALKNLGEASKEDVAVNVNSLIDGEDVWRVDSGELMFREQITIEHH